MTHPTVAARKAAKKARLAGSRRRRAVSAGSDAALPPAAEDNWDQRLGFLMHDVSRLRRNVFNEFMKPLGVTRSQWWVLAHLSRNDGMTQSDLAQVLDLGKAALGGLVDRLEAAGLIERRSDDSDRRVKRVYIVAAGTQLVGEMRSASNAMSERILLGLAHEDRLALAELLSHVKRNLLSLRGESNPAD